MNINWQNFLTDKQATINDGIVQHFKPQDIEINYANNESIISDCSRLCFIEVTGDDANNFLQGQLSNDITHVDANHAQLSSYSNPKGRMFAIFTVFSFNDKLYLLTSADLKEPLLKRLRMFVMMAKVTFKDVSEQMVCFIAAGDKIKQLSDAPSESNAVVQHENYCVINNCAGLLYFGEAEALIKQWQTLNDNGFHPVGDQAGHLLSIKNALPAVYAASSETFIPQHTNLDNLDAINFKKGCYTGQEVIARLHYLAKQKRKMYLCSVTTKTAPQITDPLYKADEKSKQGSGNIVDVAPLGNNLYLFLAVLQIADLDKTLFINEVNGDLVTIEKQPYEVISK